MNKVCLLGFPDWFIKEFCDIYNHYSDEYSKTTINCPYYFALGEKTSSDTIFSLQEAKVPHDYYNIKNIKSFKKFSCFDKIIFWDTFNLSNKYAENYYFTLTKLFHMFLTNNQKVYYCTSDLIFEPKNNIIYNNTSEANSSSNNKNIMALKYIDSLITFMKGVRKFPVNRIVIPYIIGTLDDKSSNIKQYIKSANLNSFPKRSCIKKGDIVRIFYDNCLNFGDRNYIISTNYYKYEYEFYIDLFTDNTNFKERDCIQLQKDLYLEVNEHFYNLYG